MAAREDVSGAFEASLFGVLRTVLRLTRQDPRFLVRALRVLRQQRRAARSRAASEARGVHVPPFVIYSVTGRCNLECAGCYASILHRSNRPELSDERVARLLGEARDLGVSVMLLAGGEPLLRRGLVDLVSVVPEILFLLFTNAHLLDDAAIERLRRTPHVIPVLSLEGNEQETDERRGRGTYARVREAMARLRARRVFFGTSTTLTSENLELATSEPRLRELVTCGCRLFYFINYVPVQAGTDHLQPSPEQVAELERRLAHHRRTLAALFIAFPHDEVALGGCLAAGKGFLHINAYGDVEPCPFSPYSDVNVVETSLEQALASPLFQRIVSSDVTVDEGDGRCALWKRREWVASLVKSGTEADKTGGRP